MTVKIVVGATLDGSADVILCSRLGVFSIIIVEVLAPVGVVVKRAGKNYVQAAVKQCVFALCIDAFLTGETVVVAVNDIADMQFLIDPVGIVAVIDRIVCRENLIAVIVVDILFSAEKVAYLGLVVTHIVTEVKTGDKFELVPVAHVEVALV